MRFIMTLLLVAGCHASPQAAPARTKGLALAIVYSGQGYWIGNDEYAPEPEEPMPGAHAALRVAIDAAFDSLPRGSQVAIVSYAYEPKLRLPLVPVPPQASRVVGTQREYEPNIANNLVAGIELGLEEVSRSELARKAIVVIGDGFAHDREAAARQLPQLRARAAQRGVWMHAIVVPSHMDAEFADVGVRRSIEHWTANVVTVDGPAALPAALTTIATQLAR